MFTPLMEMTKKHVIWNSVGFTRNGTGFTNVYTEQTWD